MRDALVVMLSLSAGPRSAACRSVLVALSLSLSASAAAAQPSVFPEWLGRETDAWAGRREPQLGDAAALFRAAGPTEVAALEGAVLLCRVRVVEPEGRRWDLFADPDLRMVVTVGGQRSVVWGTENSDTHVFSVPGVRLRSGGRLSMVVFDRDVTADELIGRLEARYAGRVPLELRARYAQAECRVASGVAMAERLAAALERAGAHVVALEAATPSLEDEGLGRPTTAIGESMRHLLDAAAHGSWREPRVRALRRRLDEGRRAFDVRLGRRIADAHRVAPRRREPVVIERAGAVRVHAVACGAAARTVQPLPSPGSSRPPARCVAHLDVTAGTDEVPAWLGAVDALDAGGNVYRPSQTTWVERVDPTTVRVAVVLPAIRPRGGLLRVADRRAFLRLE